MKEMIHSRAKFSTNKPFLTTNLFIILLGIFLLLVSLLIWRDQNVKNFAHLNAQIEAKLTSFSSEATSQYQAISNALIRLVDTGEPQSPLELEKWMENGRFLITTYNGLESIAWVDPSFIVRQVVSLDHNFDMLGQNASDINLDSTELQQWISVYDGNTLKGFIMGSIDMEKFSKPLIQPSLDEFMYSFSKQNKLIFTSDNWLNPEEKFIKHRFMTFQDSTMLAVTCAPTMNYIRTIAAQSRNTFVFMLMFVLLCLLAVRLAQIQYDQSKLNEFRYRSLLEEAKLVAVIFDTEGTVIFCNDFLLSLTGYTREDVIKENWFERFLPSGWEHIEESYLTSIAFKNLASHLEYPIITLDRELRWLLLNNTILRDTKGRVTGVAILGEDITQMKKVNDDLQRRLRNIQALFTIDQAITSNRNLQEILEIVLQQVEVCLNVDACAVLLLDENTQILSYATVRGFRDLQIMDTHLHLGESGGGTVALQRRMVSIHNSESDTLDFLGISTLKQEGFVCYHAIPLVVKDKVKGVLELFHRSHNHEDEEWLDFFKILAQQTSVVLDNSEMFTNLQHSNQELVAAYDSTIEGWSRAQDLRDHETEKHALRVTKMTTKLALAAGMTDQDLVHVKRGTLLHDIGKIGIPDSILFKKEKLSEEDWVLIQMHPVFAKELLSPIEYLHPAIDIPYCHHEKWDGSGYPRGLKGEQIPLAARLFAVVDVWDALISDRPYRLGWPQEKVFDYLKEQAGTHFDPVAVDLFFKVIQEESAESFTI